ncbi:response regulator [Ramlibacter sp.]|uniref:response regulator n=1 Tax=Ramlibacter sp. TaxID=1917967 RepID=UPI003D12E317
MRSTELDDGGRFRRILFRNVSLPLFLGLVSAALFVGLVLYLLEAMRWIEHSDRVVARAFALQKLDLDMEASVRGFLLTGDQRFLEPYDRAVPAIEIEHQTLRKDVADNATQVERLDRVRMQQKEWTELAQARIAARRNATNYTPGADADRGRRLKQAIREEYDEFIATERRIRQERTESANRYTVWGITSYVLFMLGMGAFLAWRGRRELLELSGTFNAALDDQHRQGEALQAQAWLREGQSMLSERLAAEQTVERIGHAGLQFLADYVDAAVAVLYVPRPDGSFRRAAAWGWTPGADDDGTVQPQRTLLAEVASARTTKLLNDVPPGYLRVSSALGSADVRALMIAPIEHEKRLNAVIEFGFLHEATARDADLMKMISGTLGAAIEAADFRHRLQEMLEETQQLNEELQVQQEELRTANEELEEQSKALKESQAHLETQQAELEQTNEQLSTLAQQLADQRDDLQKAQGELERRADELQRASRYKSEFLANMSHELRTPLNSSLILARLLADNTRGNLDEEQVKFAESIYSAGNDLLNLINDILDIAKVEAGKLEIRIGPTPVGDVADGLRSMFEPLAKRKGLTLELAVAPGTPALMDTDRHRLEQVLRNLMSNAVKFTDRGRVALAVRPEGDDRVAFEVSDTGIGIDAAQHGVIFEAFQQADGTVSRKYGGTGLGLSISRDLAHLLGGEIEVASVKGEGSTFRLTLPVEYTPPATDADDEPRDPAVQTQVAASASSMHRRPAAPRTVARASSPTAPPLTPAPTAGPKGRKVARQFDDDRAQPPDGRRNVLVIEDDVPFSRILFDLAHELGYRCVVAHEAEEGYMLAAETQPDAVLLDMRLPDGSGLSVLQRLKEHAATRHIPVHVMSVDDLAETALQMGAVGYMRKPSTRDEIREVFSVVEAKLSQKVKRVLLVEDDERQRDSVRHLIGDADVEIVAVGEGAEALQQLQDSVFDCMIIDLKLPDMSGQELLRRLAAGETRSFPPVIVYTGRNLSRDEEAELLRYSRSIIIKGARSPERLLDEVTLFLHKVETQMSTERQRMLRVARTRDRLFEGRRILVVDDDVRNIFALTSALEHKGAKVEVGRNGLEALDKLREQPDIDLVLMDIMMPEMDGYTAMREIRKEARWKKLPIIAVTAKAMRDDQEKCLAAGANDYLAKPIDLERLFSLMRVWMPKVERI